MQEKRNNGVIGKKVLRGTIIILAVTIFSKVAAFFTEALYAYYMGTTRQSDAYYAVYGAQIALTPMLDIGIWKVFLPIYKKKIAKNETDSANQFANGAITLFTIYAFIAVLLLILFSNEVVSVIAPGFEETTKVLSAKLLRISAPVQIFLVQASILAAMLQCHDKYFGSQIREVASHIPKILVAIFLYHRFGVTVLAASLVLGSILRLCVEIPFVDWGYKFRPNFKFKSPDIKSMIKKTLPVLLSEGVHQLNTLIDRMMASIFPTGAISALSYSHRLINVVDVIPAAVSAALYPQSIELIALDKKNELEQLVLRIIRLFCILIIPISIACIIFRNELVSVVFERGAFGQESVALTAGVFGLYSIGLLFTASSGILSNIFYGHGDTKTPMTIAIVNVVLNVSLNLTLSRVMGVNGLALATSISGGITFGLRAFFVRRFIKISWKEIGVTIAKAAMIGTVSCVAAKIIVNSICLNTICGLALAAVIGIAIYVMLCIAFNVKDVKEIVDRLFTLRWKARKKN